MTLGLVVALLCKPALPPKTCPSPPEVFHTFPISEIQIGKNTYKVQYPPLIIDIQDGPLLGIYMPTERIIQISTVDQNFSEMQSTFIHEILHGISAEYDVSPGLTEEQVLDIEQGLVETLRRNRFEITPVR